VRVYHKEKYMADYRCLYVIVHSDLCLSILIIIVIKVICEADEQHTYKHSELCQIYGKICAKYAKINIKRNV
jgi:hypothetical protein